MLMLLLIRLFYNMLMFFVENGVVQHVNVVPDNVVVQLVDVVTENAIVQHIDFVEIMLLYNMKMLL